MPPSERCGARRKAQRKRLRWVRVEVVTCRQRGGGSRWASPRRRRGRPWGRKQRGRGWRGASHLDAAANPRGAPPPPCDSSLRAVTSIPSVDPGVALVVVGADAPAAPLAPVVEVVGATALLVHGSTVLRHAVHPDVCAGLVGSNGEGFAAEHDRNCLTSASERWRWRRRRRRRQQRERWRREWHKARCKRRQRRWRRQ